MDIVEQLEVRKAPLPDHRTSEVYTVTVGFSPCLYADAMLPTFCRMDLIPRG